MNGGDQQLVSVAISSAGNRRYRDRFAQPDRAEGRIRRPNGQDRVYRVVV